jgi:hypothetical protein
MTIAAFAPLFRAVGLAAALVLPAGAARAADAAPQGGPFAAALRCMDTLLLEHGTRDLSVMVEDLADKTARASGGAAKDMLVSTVSQMTQRSQAIRLVASAQEWTQTVSVMSQAGAARAPLLPEYALRGALRTLDSTAGANTIGLDLSLVATRDMSIVPGTAGHNLLTLRDESNGTQAELPKFERRFAFATAERDRSGVALRSLVELATIELFGRLARVPYWSCLGASDTDAAVATEIQDWYDTMATRPAELVRHLQQQLRQRRAYAGAIDGAVNAEFKDAVARYREAVGLSREPKLSLDFFRAFLGADHAQIAARVRAPEPAAVAAAAGPATAPLTLRVASANDARRFGRGEAVQLAIQPSRDAHVYCFLHDEKRQFTRFFPNRFQRDSRVSAAGTLQLPGAMGFEIVMNPQGVAETVACFATERDVLAELPSGVAGGDFQPLAVSSIDQLRLAFAKASPGAWTQDEFTIRAR